MADGYPRFLTGPVVVEQVHAAGDDFISWSFTERIYGIAFSEDLAIAPDGTRFDPRTLVIDEDGEDAQATRVFDADESS